MFFPGFFVISGSNDAHVPRRIIRVAFPTPPNAPLKKKIVMPSSTKKNANAVNPATNNFRRFVSAVATNAPAAAAMIHIIAAPIPIPPTATVSFDTIIAKASPPANAVAVDAIVPRAMPAGTEMCLPGFFRFIAKLSSPFDTSYVPSG